MDNHHKHHFTPTLQDPTGTPVPNHVKEDAQSHGSDIHTQLRREAAQQAASQPGGLTKDNSFSTVPAWALEYTKISKRRNSWGSEDNNNGDGRQQFPGFPSVEYRVFNSYLFSSSTVVMRILFCPIT